MAETRMATTITATTTIGNDDMNNKSRGKWGGGGAGFWGVTSGWGVG